MADLTGTTVAANYLKASPSTQFGTRAISFYSVAGTGFNTNYSDSDSNFAKAVRAIETIAEVYLLGTPASAGFVVGIATDTANAYVSSNGDTDVAAAIDAVVTNATSISTTVTAKTLTGVTLA